jgi:putative ABC transport system permease protein
MSSMREPPRVARALLDRFLPDDERGRAIRGDLMEEFRRDSVEGRARRRYWRHALSIAIRFRSTRKPRPVHEAPSMLESVLYDAKHAVRSYLKAPGFTLAVVATLALGIGASTAIFSLVDGIVLRPLPFPDPDRIVFAEETARGGGPNSVSWLDFVDWRARARSFESLAASRNDVFVWTGAGRAERLTGRHVTAAFFHVLGVKPALGRDFVEDDDRRGAAAVAIVSNEFWKRSLGGDPDAIGRTLVLEDNPTQIVGVLPARFTYMRAYDVFVPTGPISSLAYFRARSDHAGYYAIGRLKDGVTIGEARQDLHAIAVDLQRQYPDSNDDIDVSVQTLASRVVIDVRRTLFVLLGAVSGLLLIACANVANLLVARGAARQREIAVRAALGGGRLRLIRQLLIESSLLSGIGGALGVILAVALLRALVAAAPEGTPRIDDVSVDRAALLFGLGAAAFCGLAFGTFPALQAASVDTQELVLRGRAGGASARSHRLRRVLIAFEVALALVLLTGAGLMIRTLGALTRVDAGFQPDRLLTMRASLRDAKWRSVPRGVFYEELLTRVRAVPGVTKAALVSALPIDGSNWNSPFTTADRPAPPRNELPAAAITLITADYFETMDTTLVRGRAFTRGDVKTASAVVIVNELLARRVWPGEDAIGKHIKRGFPEDPEAWREVVGIVRDVRFQGLAEQPLPQIYMPMAQESTSDFAIVARGSVDPLALRSPIESAVANMSPDIPIYSVRPMARMIDASIGRERMSVLVLGVFAFVALTLAGIGVYGLVAHAVTERTHEIGVRVALGADRRHVVSLIARQALSMVLAGAIVGVVAAQGLSRFIASLLYGVAPTDVPTTALVVAVMFAVAAVACALPAWRAARLDPAAALRTE